MSVAYIFILSLAARAAALDEQKTTDQLATNPIRKVVTMLQSMEKKISAEGTKESELYDKFMCYCKNSGGTLGKSISDAEAKIPNVDSDIKSTEAKVVQDKSDLKKAQSDRAEAKSAMAEATALRAKEAGEFAAEKASATADISSLASAIAAIEKGMSGFVQTQAASHLKQMVLNSKDLADFDRETLVSFLAGTQSDEYAPASGQITGILKEMKDSMSKGLASASASEASSISTFDELMAAKTKEVNALTRSIEAKTVRVGEMAVEIVQMKQDLSDTQANLLEDQKFLANMDKNCAQKSAEYDANQKVRSEELLALADTIKLLNDDDALELFKKTLPASSASLLQMKTGTASQRSLALAKIAEAKSKSGKNPSLDFIALALQGKKVDFGKVIKMIDSMVVTLQQEQTDDDNKKQYCAKQFDSADDKQKGLERSVSDLENEMAKGADAIATMKEEIKALEDGIKALDKEVAEATDQRKEENQDYTELMSSDHAAIELLGFAKNRLQKFYNPKLYKAPGAPALIQLAEVRAHQQDAPAPPPATAGAFKKSEESSGVLAMIDLLVKDLDKEMTEAQASEKHSQADYEAAMQDSADKRASDSKTLTDKNASKASIQEDLERNKEEKASTTKELMATHSYIASLHAECDWLLQYFEVRKEARTGEIDSLKNAKSVLSGADFSLVQSGRSLRGVAA